MNSDSDVLRVAWPSTLVSSKTKFCPSYFCGGWWKQIARTGVTQFIFPAWPHIFFEFVLKKKAVTGKSAYPAYKKNSQRKAAKSKRVVARTARNEKTVKQLLGELYGDKQYLEKLLQETGNYI